MSAQILGSLTLALTAALWTTVSSAQQDDTANYEGSVSCEVRGVSVVGIDEGQHMSYAGVDWLPNVGDVVIVKYRIENARLWRSLIFSVHEPPGDENASMINALIREGSEENLITRQTDQSVAINEGNTRVSVALGDTVSARVLASEVRLTRYYKADWQGVYIKRGFFDEYVYAATLRCQQSQDVLRAFSEQLIEVFGQD